MATEVVMPKLGLTMEQGTIGSWLAVEGDQIKKGQPLIEVVTDKVTMDVEAQVTGVLRKIIVEAGKEVPVATLVGVIGTADEDITGLLNASSGAAADDALGHARVALAEDNELLLELDEGVEHLSRPSQERELAVGLNEERSCANAPPAHAALRLVRGEERAH